MFGDKTVRPLEGWPLAGFFFDRKGQALGCRVTAWHRTPDSERMAWLLMVVAAVWFAIANAGKLWNAPVETLVPDEFPRFARAIAPVALRFGFVIGGVWLFAWMLLWAFRYFLMKVSVVEFRRRDVKTDNGVEEVKEVRVSNGLSFPCHALQDVYKFRMESDPKAVAEEVSERWRGKQMGRFHRESYRVVMPHASGDVVVAVVFGADDARRLLNRLQYVQEHWEGIVEATRVKTPSRENSGDAD